VSRFFLVLTGGIGGAKLCLGLQRILPAESLRIAVNVGDDFEHLGLRICPDLDTTIYTLGGLANTEFGWGRRDETWTFMKVLENLGGESWFRLGDGDLALHVERTRRLLRGETLSYIMSDVASRLGVRCEVFPVSDDILSTVVVTAGGELEFQDYFVRCRCVPVISGLRFRGAERAGLAEPVVAALDSPDLGGIIIAPSNPYLSIDPILAVPQMRSRLERRQVPAIAVTPIIGGAAVKGPAAKIMKELGIEVSAGSIVEHYRGLIDGFVLDSRDAPLAEHIDIEVRICDTLMNTLEDRDRVARTVAEFGRQLRR